MAGQLTLIAVPEIVSAVLFLIPRRRVVGLLLASADGGGTANAVPSPVFSASNVARFLVGARQKLVPAELVSQIVEINGKPGLLGYVHGHPFGVVTIEISAGRISRVYIVSNPDKLSRLPALSASTC